jgi:hypothetical protein
VSDSPIETVALPAMHGIGIPGRLKAEPDHVCSLRVVSDIFRTRVLHAHAQTSGSAPVCQLGSLTLAHVANRDIYLVAVVRNNANVVMALQWLHSVRALSNQISNVEVQHVGCASANHIYIVFKNNIYIYIYIYEYPWSLFTSRCIGHESADQEFLI